MNILTLVTNPFQVNTYIIFNSEKKSVIIDPACSNQQERNYFIEEIEKLGLQPEKILLTHGHIDHIVGVEFMKQFYNIPVYAHKHTELFISKAEESAYLFGFEFNSKPSIDYFLEHGDNIGIENINFSVFHTPGHASGSLCFYEKNQNVVFTGDVLFMQSIGRTDLPTGDMDTLIFHIKEFLLNLPPNTIVYPGHGPSTTIEHEIKFNPFLS